MLIVVDTETAGLPLRPEAPYTDIEAWPRLIGLAWSLHTSTGAQVRARDSLVRPAGFRIPAAVGAITGIDQARALRDGLPLRALLTALLEDLERYRPTLLVGHHVAFDRQVLLAELTREGSPTTLEQLPTFCTMRAGAERLDLRRSDRELRSLTLEALHRELFNAGYADAGTPAAEVQACARCFFRLQQGPGGDHLSADVDPAVPRA